ncbi:uncharacterized [Tachysurus ichikawai]
MAGAVGRVSPSSAQLLQSSHQLRLQAESLITPRCSASLRKSPCRGKDQAQQFRPKPIRLPPSALRKVPAAQIEVFFTERVSTFQH